jgi:hypothetical protein
MQIWHYADVYSKADTALQSESRQPTPLASKICKASIAT